MNKLIKNRFSKSEKVISPKGVTKAQQQFKDDADINSIMRKFQKTGAITHVAAHRPQYDVATSITLHEAMNIVTKADTMFQDLPSSLRERFATPDNFLDFVQNPDNEQEAHELGLALSPEAQAVADQRTPPAPEAPPEPTPAEPPPADPS